MPFLRTSITEPTEFVAIDVELGAEWKFQTGVSIPPALITADLSKTLGPLVLVATGGTTASHADLSKTLGALTLSATGTEPISANLNQIFISVLISATAQNAISANLTKTLGNLALSSAGTVASANPFAYYSAITVQSGQVPSTQTDFPMLISVTDNRFKTVANGGHVQNSSGFDVRPFSDTGLTTALTYELERYNASTGEVVMWVKISSLAVGSIVYLGYGNTTLTTNGSNGASTFSNNFLHVYHLKDGTTLSLTNSTGDVNLANQNSCTATTGQIDGAVAMLSASSQHLNSSAGTAGANTLTFSAWVKATSFPNSYNCVMQLASAGNKVSVFFVKSNGKMYFYTDTGVSTSVSFDGTGSHTLSTGTWYYLTMVYDSTSGLIGYVNAASDNTVAANGNPSASRTFVDIGNYSISAGLRWNGSIDEVRYSQVVRSANWITTEYNNQSAPGTFATMGTEVPT